MKFIIVITIFIFKVCYSQNYKIKYNVVIQPMEKNSQYDESDYVNDCIKTANQLNFTLTFNNNISFFKLNEYNKDNELYSIAIAMVGSEEIYVNKNNKEVLYETNDKIIIKENYNEKNWKITNELKTIGDFQCYKATYQNNYLDRKGNNRTNEIVAWYAPKLPFSFGPKNYYGLPGLILEVTENKKTYIATKIELSSKVTNIKLPKGKTITKKEYEDRLKSNMGAIISKTVKKN